MLNMLKKRIYKIRVVNKGWFKKGNKPHNFGKPMDSKTKKELSITVKKAMKKLPESIKRRIKRTQFKRGHYYSHWTGKYGEEHPNYKGIAYRNKALSLKKKICEKCGRRKFDSLTKLHVHHKDGNRRNNNIKNLKLLCSKCHLKLHKNWEFRWKKKIICDIDGILCENTRVPYLLKAPYPKNIHTINNLYKKGFDITLFTSRRNQYKKQTIKWLDMHKVKYHQLIMCKPKGDYYCDDKLITLKQLNKMGG